MRHPDDEPMDPRAEYGQMPTFTEFLAQHSAGDAEEQITDLFARLLLAVRQTEKTGSITIKVKAEPVSGALVNITVEADARMPKVTPPFDLLYIDPSGLPARQNPAQMRLAFDDLTGNKKPAATTDLTTKRTES